MEWKYILPYHKKPPTIRFQRHPYIQNLYDNDNTTEKELFKKLFKRDELWVMTKNKYPYYFVDDTQHYIIWFRNKINYELVEFLLRDYNDVVYYQNIKVNRSINTIPHVHVFIKNN